MFVLKNGVIFHLTDTKSLIILLLKKVLFLLLKEMYKLQTTNTYIYYDNYVLCYYKHIIHYKKIKKKVAKYLCLWLRIAFAQFLQIFNREIRSARVS